MSFEMLHTVQLCHKSNAFLLQLQPWRQWLPLKHKVLLVHLWCSVCLTLWVPSWYYTLLSNLLLAVNFEIVKFIPYALPAQPQASFFQVVMPPAALVQVPRPMTVWFAQTDTWRIVGIIPWLEPAQANKIIRSVYFIAEVYFPVISFNIKKCTVAHDTKMCNTKVSK